MKKKTRKKDMNKLQASVVQRLDRTIHRINRYPVNKC